MQRPGSITPGLGVLGADEGCAYDPSSRAPGSPTSVGSGETEEAEKRAKVLYKAALNFYNSQDNDKALE
jgi:hypothetical protein